MSVLLAIAFQSTGTLPITERPSCDPAEHNEIIVCALGEDADQFRIPKGLRDEREDHSPRRIRIDLGDGATVEAYGDQGEVGGFVSRRIMTGVKIPF